MGEWCEVRRAEARARMVKVRPSAKSTGPRSVKGKRQTRLNFYPPNQREFMGELLDVNADIEELSQSNDGQEY
jgi:hypothetical protein